MFIIYTNTYIPYEFDTLEETIDYIIQMSHGLKSAIRLVEKNTEHLVIRCPVSGEYLDILSSEANLNELHELLISRNLYRQ